MSVNITVVSRVCRSRSAFSLSRRAAAIFSRSAKSFSRSSVFKAPTSRAQAAPLRHVAIAANGDRLKRPGSSFASGFAAEDLVDLFHEVIRQARLDDEAGRARLLRFLGVLFLRV